MPNRLAQEQSLYLKQHANNPVDWWPWCDEAFQHAKETGKPIIVSIGYSACHWCHVMAHESFEDDYIAGLMNEHYVCIKVDREERPDIDQIYMEAVQMINQHGGWPLNAFLLPDGRPFFGGTYFPPEDRGQGIVPWPQLLMRVSDYYKKNKGELEENAENILKNMLHSNSPSGAGNTPLSNEALIQAAQAIAQAHDSEWGGFSEAPKFPPSMTLNFLLAIRSTQACESNGALTKQIDFAVENTLKCMAHGGLFDQVGGGFARYSVDKYWVIPHFEKMLYDNGLLLDIYTKGFLRYQNPLFAAVVKETIDWLEREMLDPKGCFYSALDADSEGEEGKYYVWLPEEVKAILGETEGSAFCEAYSITEKGNFEKGTSNPVLVYSEIEKREAFASHRQKLLEARSKRVAPGKDEKALLAWNSLVIRGMAEAAFYFNNKDWFGTAKKAADWIWDNLRSEDNRLQSVHYEEGAAFNAYLDDYAYYMEALLSLASKADWFEPNTASIYIERAKQLMDVVLDQFMSEHEIGFYFTSNDHEALISRKKVWFDNAIPAGNSSIIHSLSSLYALTGDNRYGHELNELRKAYTGMIQKVPTAISHALSAYTSDAMGIAVIKVKGTTDLTALQTVLSSRPWRKTFIQITDDSAQPDGYQLCIGTQCVEPANDPQDLAELI